MTENNTTGDNKTATEFGNSPNVYCNKALLPAKATKCRFLTYLIFQINKSNLFIFEIS